MGTEGERINKMGFGEKKPLVLKGGKEEITVFFDLFLPESVNLEASHYGDEYAERMAKKLSHPLTKTERERAMSAGMIKFYASVGFQDKDGAKVWDSPEDVNPSGIIFPQIQNFILREVLGFLPEAFDEEAVKK